MSRPGTGHLESMTECMTFALGALGDRVQCYHPVLAGVYKTLVLLRSWHVVTYFGPWRVVSSRNEIVISGRRLA